MKIFALLLVLVAAATSQAENWPQFRGPAGLGTCAERDLPLTWNAKTGDNIAWRAPLPKSDNPYSSPIVWGERVFVTCVTNEPLAHHVLCFATADGQPLWDATVEPGPLMLRDLRGGYGAPTPCTDGQRVYAVFGSAVIAAFDFDGKPVWRKTLANIAFDVALGSSPILFGDTVILDCDQTGRTSSIVAFDKTTGEIRWEAQRPETGFAHSTPVIVEVAGRPLMLVSASKALQGVDPANGKILWWCTAQGDASSPAFGGGWVFSDSGRGGKPVCVDPTGAGDVTKTHLQWTFPQIPEGLSSAIIVGEHVWRTHNPEMLKCIRLADGALAFTERLPGVSTWASPFATPDGRIYFASAGKSFVLRSGEKLEVLATNEIGEEGRASAAVSGGKIFLRGDKNLYCIGRK
ncbi:MAG: outer membrane protein assembly factor BamB [Chthoniobacter sp.]|jgi:outer membrane protein assembly factor BamB|nr:outer membrane protein assembly factor BamB [Chthoniobacter sp.]